MKITDYFLVPLCIIILSFLEEFYMISFVVQMISIIVVACIQTYLIYTRMQKKLNRETKNFEFYLSEANKDRQLIESQLQTVFNNIPIALALMDTYGNLVLVNHRFNDFISGKGNHKLLYNSEIIDREVRIFLNDSFLTEKEVIRNIMFNHKDYQCVSTPVYEQEHYAGCLLIFQDITSVAEKERMQKRFIADASHELRTPIAAIKGMIEILNREDFDDQETLLDFHQQIAKETARLEMIVMDLLQLSRLSAGTVIINKTLCDLNPMIQSVIKEVKSGINTQKTSIIFNSEVDRKVSADKEKLHHVVSNLLRNALMHSEADEVVITLKLKGKMLELSLKDNGIGIEQQHLENIFERFYRVDTHRARTSGGSGLGLPICKSIVSAHGGTISIKSIPQQGCEFLVQIPI